MTRRDYKQVLAFALRNGSNVSHYYGISVVIFFFRKQFEKGGQVRRIIVLVVWGLFVLELGFGVPCGIATEKQSNQDFDRTVSDYSKALERNPHDASAYYNRGLAYSRTGEYDRAIADFNKALELNPKLAEAYFSRALVYGRKGEYDLAISDFNKVLEMNPKLAQAYYNRGLAYFEKKDYDKVWDDIHKAQSLGFQVNPDIVVALRRALTEKPR